MIRMLVFVGALASCFYCARRGFEDWDEDRKLMSLGGAVGAFTSLLIAFAAVLPFIWRE